MDVKYIINNGLIIDTKTGEVVDTIIDEISYLQLDYYNNSH
jgi:hypothetical protein